LWLGAEFAHNSTAVLRWLAVGVFSHSLAVLPWVFIQGAGVPISPQVHIIELDVVPSICGSCQHYGVPRWALAWTHACCSSHILIVCGAALSPATRPFAGRIGAAFASALTLLWGWPHAVSRIQRAVFPGSGSLPSAGSVSDFLFAGRTRWLGWRRRLRLRTSEFGNDLTSL